MSKIAIIYISQGEKDNTTYNSLRIERKVIDSEMEGEQQFANYCCGLEVSVHLIYQGLQADSVDNDNGTITHFIKDSNFSEILTNIDAEYFCIIYQGMILTSRNWLVNLLFSYEHINKSGVIGITTDTTKQTATFLPDKEEGETIVFMPSDGIVNGIAFFSKRLYFEIGVLGNDLRGWEIPHFCVRAMKNLYENYCVDGEFAFGELKNPDAIGRYNMQKELLEMEIKKNWYVSK